MESREMNGRVDASPKTRNGLFRQRLLILVAFGILFVVAGVGGSLWALRHVYLSDKPAPIPEATIDALDPPPSRASEMARNLQKCYATLIEKIMGGRRLGAATGGMAGRFTDDRA
jgi:hypothetical protein